MGVSICPAHGEQSWVHGCKHFAAAARSGAACPGVEAREFGWSDGRFPPFPVWLCAGCAETGPWPPSGTPIDSDSFPDPIPMDDLVGVCDACLAAWLAANDTTGQARG
jgi:hypothetical protein